MDNSIFTPDLLGSVRSLASKAPERASGVVAAGETPDGRAGALGGVGASVSPLDTIANFVNAPSASAACLPDWDAKQERLALRFAMQAGARSLLPAEAVSECLRVPRPGAAGVDVMYVPSVSCGRLVGLKVCGRLWQCPVCAATISERRRVDMASAFEVWMDRGVLVLVTFTLQHKRGDGALLVVERLTEGLRYFQNSRGWKGIRKRYQVAGFIRAFEMTVGVAGFHPHFHMPVFMPAGVDVDSFAAEVRSAWLSSVAAVGGYASALACDIRSGNAELAAYVQKYGRDPKWTLAHEVSKSASKNARGSGRSLSELLRDYALHNDKQAGALWVEAVSALKGRSQSRWSPGLRDRFQLGAEKTDMELVTESREEAVFLARLSLHEWRAVVANDARSELLALAGTGDGDRVLRFVRALPGALEEGI